MARNEIAIAVYSKKDISDFSYAEKIISYCQEAGLFWTKIDDKEPIRKVYSKELLHKFWLTPKYAGSNKSSPSLNTHIFCNQGRGGCSLYFGWKKNNPNRYNPFYIYIPYKKFSASIVTFEQLFFNIINLLEPECAYIENEKFWLKCRTEGSEYFSVDQDVHWISYFSNERMKVMQVDINTLQWNKVLELPQGKVFYISENIPKDEDESEKACFQYRNMLWK